jgi:diaminopimelate epimerase
VQVPGGELGVEWRETDGHVLMTGPVEYERDGNFPEALTADAETA